MTVWVTIAKMTINVLRAQEHFSRTRQFQAYLTRKKQNLYFDRYRFFKNKHFPWEARKVTPAKKTKFLLQVQPVPD